MQRSLAALLLALTAGCASDVDLQLGLEGSDADGGTIGTSVGTLRAARVLPGGDHIRVVGAAWLSPSIVVVSGDFESSIDLGTGPVAYDVYPSGFVAAYDTSSGEPVWARTFAGSSATDASYQRTSSSVMDVAITSDGIVSVAGGFGRTIDFGTGPIVSTDGCIDGVIARYASDGTPLEPFVMPESYVYAIAAMPDGGLAIAGWDTNGDCRTTEEPIVRFVARLDADGQIVWKVPFGSKPFIEKVATSPDGDIVVLGMLEGRLELGDFAVTAVAAGAADSFLARLSPDGEPAWLASCLRTELEGECNASGDITFTAEGRVLASGSFRRRVDLAGAIIETGRPDTDRMSTYVAELGDHGQPTVLAVVESLIGHGIDTREDPFELVIAGEGGAMEARGPYVGVLAGAATLASARGMSDPELGTGIAWDVAVAPSGEIALVGAFHGEADFGNGPVRSETDGGGFVAIYDRDVTESVR